ncbi:MAG: hypothetical protein F2840_07680 [Actinobacteria bacterium]|jgi:hypothetical protein|uniref:Unannotated protein n=1 Tax=freshwater metagenome TaxID=449393 RepID=A0A6J7K418_9ZZZZ|nr:hypothetical protein [Actinomycetota bacterium]
MLKRVITGFIALGFLAIAAVGLFAGGWVWSTFGSQGLVSESMGRLTGSATSQAIVIDVERVGGEIPYLPVTGVAGLIATPAIGAPGPPAIFVAQAPAETANEYLSGARYDVGRINDGEWSLTSVPGFRDLDPPQDANWQASASGPSARLALETATPITVVVMNADGSPPVDVLLTLQLAVPDAVTIAVVLGIVGLVALIIGLLFLRACLGRGRQRGVHEATSA